MTRQVTRFFTYENRLIAVLSLSFGVVFLDRSAMSFLAPFVARDLHLDNMQIGMLATGLSLTWATAGVVFGRLCDKVGHHRTILVAAIIMFSLCSVLSGLAGSFAALLAVRVLMGLSEGPVLPVSQVVLALESSAKRRGLNMGLMQQFGSNILGTFLAPIVLVAVATNWGWREAFFVAGIPGLVCAFLVWRTLRDPKLQGASAPHIDATRGRPFPIREALRFRNVCLAMLLSGLSVAWATLCFVFLPLYFVKAVGFSPATMSVLMSLLGLSALIASMVVPALSDRFGRKPIIVGVTFFALLLPAGLLLAGHRLWVIIPCLLVGFLATGATPLLMATIPAETIRSGRAAGIVGLVMGFAEIFAALMGPLLGGIFADKFDLAATLWLQVGFLIVSVVSALFLHETAPRCVASATSEEAIEPGLSRLDGAFAPITSIGAMAPGQK